MNFAQKRRKNNRCITPIRDESTLFFLHVLHQCVLIPHSSSNLCHFFQLVGRSYSVNIPFTSRLFVHNPTQWYELSQSNNKNIRYEKLIFGVCDSSSKQKSLNPERLKNKCKEKHKTLLVCHPVYKISFIINNQ